MKKQYSFRVHLKILLGLFIAVAGRCEKEPIIEDEAGVLIDSRDNLTYKWVTIGNQVWMAENLRYLPFVVGFGTGSETTEYCYVFDYNGTDVNAAKATANYQNYGALYNWPAVMNGASSSSSNPSEVQGICPPGWHVPSDAEWKQLVNYLGLQGYLNEWKNPKGAGNALKSCYQVNSPLTGDCNKSQHPRWDSDASHYGTNDFGFSALPGGYRYNDGFNLLGFYGIWWSATEFSATDGWSRSLSYQSGSLYGDYNEKLDGFSVRCVKD